MCENWRIIEMEEAVDSLYGFKFRVPDKRRERLNADGSRRYDIQQLWQRSHEILNLALLGHKQVEIAKMLRIDEQTVCNTLNSTLGKETLAEKRKSRDEEYDKLQDKVLELTRKSLDIYERIVGSSPYPKDENYDPEVTLKMQKETADTITLDLAGMKAPTRIDTRSMHMNLGSDEIAELKKRGYDAALAAGKIVNVNPSEGGEDGR
jgi:hypothetical protein